MYTETIYRAIISLSDESGVAATLTKSDVCSAERFININKNNKPLNNYFRSELRQHLRYDQCASMCSCLGRKLNGLGPFRTRKV